MITQITSDQELIRQYIKGNNKAFEIFLNRHQQRIYSYIFVLVKDKQLAEDIYQDTLIKVIRTLNTGKYNEEGKMIYWILRIAHNLIIDHFRNKKKLPEKEIIENEETSDDCCVMLSNPDLNIEQNIIKTQTHAAIRQMVDELPEEQKEVLVMRHYVNMSFKEIAEQTGVSINTALGRMRYALINLRRMIGENEKSLTVC